MSSAKKGSSIFNNIDTDTIIKGIKKVVDSIQNDDGESKINKESAQKIFEKVKEKYKDFVGEKEGNELNSDDDFFDSDEPVTKTKKPLTEVDRLKKQFKSEENRLKEEYQNRLSELKSQFKHRHLQLKEQYTKQIDAAKKASSN